MREEMNKAEEQAIRTLKHSPKRKRKISKSQLRNVSAWVDSGIMWDKSGKAKLREDPNKIFAQECLNRIRNDPVIIPDDPEFRNAKIIKSTKGNLVAMLFGSDSTTSIADLAKREVEKKDRELKNRLIWREVKEHKIRSKLDTKIQVDEDYSSPDVKPPKGSYD